MNPVENNTARESPTKGHRRGKAAEIMANQQIKLSGKRTLHLQTSGESKDTEGAKISQVPRQRHTPYPFACAFLLSKFSFPYLRKEQK